MKMNPELIIIIIIIMTETVDKHGAIVCSACFCWLRQLRRDRRSLGIAEFAGLEFAGVENDGLENDGVAQE